SLEYRTRIFVKSVDIKYYAKLAHNILPIALLFAMVCAFVLLDAVLPLQYLRLYDVSLTHLGTWPLLPAHILFPRFAVVEVPVDKQIPRVIMFVRSWKETALLFSVFVLAFLLYLLA